MEFYSFKSIILNIENPQNFEVFDMTIRACVYARVSTTPKFLERQIRELKDIAAKNDWVIVDTYIDNGISGSMGRDKRPELNRVMKDSITRKFDVVMVSSIDRLGRFLQQLIEIVNA